MLKVFEAFAGYGSQRMALEKIGIEHEVVAISEFDKFAIASYEAIHGKTNNLGDITKIDVRDVPEHDLFTYSFPCQDISIAGTQKGFDKGGGTRSGLLWECERIISAKKPKYLLMENVKNLISKKFMPGFVEWIEYLETIGYSNYYEVLNAKDFGIPQNRERVFMVSVLGEHNPYIFPKPTKLEKRLKDILEKEVEEKYYLDEEKTRQLVVTMNDQKEIKEQEGIKMNRKQVKETQQVSHTLLARDYKGFGNQDMTGVIEPTIKQIGNTTPNSKRENPQTGRTYDTDGLAPTLNTMQGGNRQPQIVEPQIAASRGRGKENKQQLEINSKGTSNTITTVQKDNYVMEGLPIKNATKKGYLMATDGDGIDLAYAGQNTRRGRVQKDSIQTLTTDDNKGVLDQFRIRKLTPLECWRLMGVKDEYFYKAQEVNSNSQLYKQAGNSIVVQVLEAIFRNLLLEVPKEDLIGEHITLF